MNLDFEFIKYNRLMLLVYRPWWEQGVVHGMTTRQLSFVGDATQHELDLVKESLGASQLALLRQCHGSDLVDFRDAASVRSMLSADGDLIRRRSGDVLVLPARQSLGSDVIIYGIMTADCVPIIVRGDDGYLLIHAGWRGLASGVIATGLRNLRMPREAVIFAAAGPDRYEVEMDVIAAIGDSAVYRPAPSRTGKYLLDTVATSIKQLANFLSEQAVYSPRMCTISDLRFHSYRRDGSRSGRCMSFVMQGK